MGWDGKGRRGAWFWRYTPEFFAVPFLAFSVPCTHSITDPEITLLPPSRRVGCIARCVRLHFVTITKLKMGDASSVVNRLS